MSAAALLALTACSGSFADASGVSSASARTNDPTGAASSASSGDASGTSSAAASSFCEKAGSLVSRTDPRSVDTSKPAEAARLFTQAAGTLRSIDPPSEIVGDWSAVGDGLADLAAAFGKADLSTVAGESRLERSITQIQTQIGPAQNRVNSYLQNTCGVSVAGSTATSSNPAPVLVPTPSAP